VWFCCLILPIGANTIVTFEPSSALEFNDEKTVMELCERLNLDKQSLADAGYSEFEIIEINYQSHMLKAR